MLEETLGGLAEIELLEASEELDEVADDDGLKRLVEKRLVELAKEVDDEKRLFEVAAELVEEKVKDMEGLGELVVWKVFEAREDPLEGVKLVDELG